MLRHLRCTEGVLLNLTTNRGVRNREGPTVDMPPADIWYEACFMESLMVWLSTAHRNRLSDADSGAGVVYLAFVHVFECSVLGSQTTELFHESTSPHFDS
jgi:hypothetical protein